MQKDQEEYIRDLQLKEAEKVAKKNNMQVSQTSLRTFRKRQGNFTIFDQNAEFNQYPDLGNYKMEEVNEQENQHQGHQRGLSRGASTVYSLSNKNIGNPGYLTARGTSRNDNRFAVTMTARNPRRNHLRQLLQKRKKERTEIAFTNKMMTDAKVRMNKKQQEALKRKKMQMLDMKAVLMISRYRGIDNLLAEHDRKRLDKDLIHYCVLQYLIALKQYFANIYLKEYLRVLDRNFKNALDSKLKKQREEEELRRLHEEKIKLQNEQMQLEIQKGFQ